MLKKISKAATDILTPKLSAVTSHNTRAKSDEPETHLDVEIPTQRVLHQIITLFTPIVDQLNGRIQDTSGEMKFRLFAIPANHILSEKPEIKVSIGLFNDKEAEAIQYYMSEEGGYSSSYIVGTSKEKADKNLTYSALSQKNFDFTAPVNPKRERLIFFGMWKTFNTPASHTKDLNKVLHGLVDKFFGEHSFFAAQGNHTPPADVISSLPMPPHRAPFKEKVISLNP